ncbi:MAG: glycosyltransferase [Terriglobales bacterium]
MRLLYFALDSPLPANNGLRLRTWTILRALHAEGARIELICLAPVPLGEFDGVRAVCDEFWTAGHRGASLSRGRDYYGRMRALGSRQPYSARRFRSPAASALLRELCARNHHDAVICDTVFPAGNLPPELPPLVLNHHNIEHRIFESYARQQGWSWRRAAVSWEGQRVARWEATVGRRTALNLVCSEVDRCVLLEQQPEANIAVVPNIAPQSAVPDVNTEEDPDLVVFQGALDWLPNRDAVDWFLADVWPAVLARCPSVRFQVVGRNPPEDFLARHRGRARVEFTGTVTDVRPYLGRAAVAIAPMRIGSGTRLKILEAAGMAKAVVATPLGAQGLHFVPGVEIELADSSIEFAALLLQLLRSPERRQMLGAAAQTRVRTEYSFGALRQSLRRALSTLDGCGTTAPGLTVAFHGART